MKSAASPKTLFNIVRDIPALAWEHSLKNGILVSSVFSSILLMHGASAQDFDACAVLAVRADAAAIEGNDLSAIISAAQELECAFYLDESWTTGASPSEPEEAITEVQSPEVTEPRHQSLATLQQQYEDLIALFRQAEGDLAEARASERAVRAQLDDREEDLSELATRLADTEAELAEATAEIERLRGQQALTVDTERMEDLAELREDYEAQAAITAQAQPAPLIDTIFQWVESAFAEGGLEPSSLDGFVLDDAQLRLLPSPTSYLYIRPRIEQHDSRLLRVYPQVRIPEDGPRFLRVTDIDGDRIVLRADLPYAGPNSFSFLVYLPENAEIDPDVIDLLNSEQATENAQIYAPRGTLGDAVGQRFQSLYDDGIAEVPLGCFALIFQALDSDPASDDSPLQRIRTGTCSHPDLPDMADEHRPDIYDTTGPFWVSSADAVNEVGEPLFDFAPVPILILQPEHAAMGDAGPQHVAGGNGATEGAGENQDHTTPEDDELRVTQTVLQQEDPPTGHTDEAVPATLPEAGVLFLAGFDALDRYSTGRVTEMPAPCGNQAVAYVVPAAEAIAQGFVPLGLPGDVFEELSAGLQSLRDGTAEGQFQVPLDSYSAVFADVDLSLYQGNFQGDDPVLVVVRPVRGSSPQTERQATLWLPDVATIEEVRLAEGPSSVSEGACGAQEPPPPVDSTEYLPFCLTGPLRDGGYVSSTYAGNWIQEPSTSLSSIGGDHLACTGFGDAPSGITLDPRLTPRERTLRVQLSGVTSADIPELEAALRDVALSVAPTFPASDAAVAVDVSITEIQPNPQGGVDLLIGYAVNTANLRDLISLPSMVGGDFAIEFSVSGESPFRIVEPAILSLPSPTAAYQATYDIGEIELSRRDVTLPETFDLVTLLPRSNGAGVNSHRNYFCNAMLVSDALEGDIRLEFVGDGTEARISAESMHLATGLPPETEFRLVTFPNSQTAAAMSIDQSTAEAICGGSNRDTGYRYTAAELATMETLVLPYARPLLVYVLRSQASDPAYGRYLRVALQGTLDFVGLLDETRLVDVRLPLHPNGFVSIASPQYFEPISTRGVVMDEAFLDRQLPGAPPSLDRVMRNLDDARDLYGLPEGVWPDAVIFAFNDTWNGCHQLYQDLNRSRDLSELELGGARILVINDSTGERDFNSLRHDNLENGTETAPWHFERCAEPFGDYELGYLRLATLGFINSTGEDFSFSRAFEGFGDSWANGARASDPALEQFIEALRTSTVSDQKGLQQ